jgi:hypothetical protein
MKSHIINPKTLPILTDTVDGTPIDLPILTEAVENRLGPTVALPLSDQQCRQLAEQLFPGLVVTLHDAIGSRSEARWEKAMQEVGNALPELIRKAVQKPL